MRNLARDFVRDFARDFVCNLRRRHQVRFPRCLVHRRRQCRGSLRHGLGIVSEFRYFWRCLGSGPVLFFFNFRIRYVLMLFVQRLGEFGRKDRLIFRKDR